MRGELVMDNSHKGSKDGDIQSLLEQYKETMRSLVKQGKLTHRELEKNLADVIDQMVSVTKKVTAEIIEEEPPPQEKKSVPVRVVGEKLESMSKTQK
jgi:hypothetical protein